MLESAKCVVIKIGSSLIIGEDGLPRKEWLATLAEDIAALKKHGARVVVVTSGAIALGRPAMSYGKRALTLEEKQAAAACGQIRLFSLWQEVLEKEKLFAAQILLTADDSIERKRYLNARNTLETLFENAAAIPVINENDTVATSEIKFGDNDRLSARVAQMAGADVLILFSDVDGLYDADPRKNKNAKLIKEVGTITPDIERMAGGASSAVASGGMRTKIEAARIAMHAGCHMIIARGEEDHPLRALEKGGMGTRFVAQGNPMSARKHWIAGSVHSAGFVTVDDGAAQALKSGKSLLPAGVVAISGEFGRGDAVMIRDQNGTTLGKGLIAYNAADASRILGRKSDEIEAILGFKGRGVLIHRDDLVLE